MYPAGLRLATCEEAMFYLGRILKGLYFNDVCYVQGGTVRGTRIDGRGGNRAFCDSRTPDPYKPYYFTCLLLTNLPAAAEGTQAALPPSPLR